MLGASVAAQAWAWFDTKNMLYMLSGVSLASIGLHTKAVLGEDIVALRGGGGSNAVGTSVRFCKMQHPRMVMACVSSLASVWALTFPK